MTPHDDKDKGKKKSLQEVGLRVNYKDSVFSGHWTLSIHVRDNKPEAELTKYFGGRPHQQDFVRNMARRKFPGMPFTMGDGWENDFTYGKGWHDEDPAYIAIRKPELIAEFMRQIPSVPRPYTPKVSIKVSPDVIGLQQLELTLGQDFGTDKKDEVSKVLLLMFEKYGINKHTVGFCAPYDERHSPYPEDNVKNVERVAPALEVIKSREPGKSREV